MIPSFRKIKGRKMFLGRESWWIRASHNGWDVLPGIYSFKTAAGFTEGCEQVRENTVVLNKVKRNKGLSFPHMHA